MKLPFFIVFLSIISYSQNINGIIMGEAQVLKNSDLYEKTVIATLHKNDTVKILSVVNDELYEIQKGEIKGYIWAFDVRFEGDNVRKIKELKDEKNIELNKSEEKSWFNNSDTLRYFFSAIFQGIAAILTLGAMFYMNFNDKARYRIDDLIEQTYKLYNPVSGDSFEESRRTNIIVGAEKYFVNKFPEHPDAKRLIPYIEEHNEIIAKGILLKGSLPSLLFLGIIILALSSLSLFLIDYSYVLNLYCFYMGIFIMILLGFFLVKLTVILFITAELEKFKMKDLFTLFKW